MTLGTTPPHRFADPTDPHPIKLPDGSPHLGVAFLKACVDHPQMDIGAYTYASAFDPPQDWAARLAPYLFDFSPERLTIGKFCQIADGVRFITASANHRHDGISSFPFAIFDGGTIEARPSMPGPGADTVIGNDVWLGQGACVLPGARIGNGVIVGAHAVVSGVIAPYSVVVGNPARVLRKRFDPEQIEILEAVAWWDWDIEKICAHEAEICGADVTALQRV